MSSKIKTKNPGSSWVALSLLSGNKIAEGKEPGDVIKKAKKLGEKFSLMFVPQPGVTYIL